MIFALVKSRMSLAEENNEQNKRRDVNIEENHLGMSISLYHITAQLTSETLPVCLSTNKN